MAKSIKQRIMERVMKNLEALASGVNPTPQGRVRGVSRAVDPLVTSSRTPWLFVYDGEEVQTESDHFGRTYEFLIGVKILIEANDADLGTIKDAIVPEVQRVIEGDPQFSGDANPLANIVDGGHETPFLNELGKPLGGALLLWTVQYRRRLGDPYTTY